MAIILKRITDALEEYHDVVTVNTGARALRYLEQAKPDLILLDIRMMPKDGFESLEEIRKGVRKTPLLKKEARRFADALPLFWG